MAATPSWRRTTTGGGSTAPTTSSSVADGTIWFTDPSYGIDSDYEGHLAPSEVGGCHVYRIDPSGDVHVVADDFERPNGLAFSCDERQLYVADTRRRHIRRFDVDDEGCLSGGDVFAECDAGSFDGLRLDSRGRVWAAAHDGLHCFDPDGTLLGKLHVPEVVSNLAFGGPQRNHLFITATTTLYTLKVNFSGATYTAARSKTHEVADTEPRARMTIRPTGQPRPNGINSPARRRWWQAALGAGSSASSRSLRRTASRSPPAAPITTMRLEASQVAAKVASAGANRPPIVCYQAISGKP